MTLYSLIPGSDEPIPPPNTGDIYVDSERFFIFPQNNFWVDDFLSQYRGNELLGWFIDLNNGSTWQPYKNNLINNAFGVRELKLNAGTSNGEYIIFKLGGNLIKPSDYEKVVLNYDFLISDTDGDIQYRLGLSDGTSGNGSVGLCHLRGYDPGSGFKWYFSYKENGSLIEQETGFILPTNELIGLSITIDSLNSTVTIEANEQYYQKNNILFDKYQSPIFGMQRKTSGNNHSFLIDRFSLGLFTGDETQFNPNDFNTHIQNKQNPHETTPQQIGAALESHTHPNSTELVNHLNDSQNPHNIIPTSIGAALENHTHSEINNHIQNNQNPHGMTIEQIGAANAQDLTNHLNDSGRHLDNVLLISEGGTGATSASQARDNLEVNTRDDLAKIVFGENEGQINDDFASITDVVYPTKSYPSITWGSGWQSAYTSGDKIFKSFAQQRIVYLNGFVKRVNGTEIRILTLPNGYRPTTTKTFPVVNSTNNFCVIKVTPFGHVEITSGIVPTSGSICLDGIIFGINA